MDPMARAAEGTGEAGSTADRVTIVKSISGIEGWLVRQPRSPVLAVDFAFEGGAALDPTGKAGLGYLISGMMDEGADDLDSAAFMQRLAAKAIDYRFENGRDEFNGSILTLSRHREEAFMLLEMALRAPRFDQDAVDRVKSQIVAGLRRQMQSPDAVCGRMFSSTLFAGHPYAQAVKGEIENVEALTSADCHAHFPTLTGRDRLKIIAVGDLTPDEFGQMIDRVFGKLPLNGSEFGIAPAELKALCTTKTIEMDVPQTVIRFAGAGIMRSDPDIFAAIVVNHILGGSAFTSRLFMEVREKRGLAYSVSSGLRTMRYAALHSGGTSTKNERAGESLTVIREEMAKLVQSVPDKDELNAAKRYITGSYPLRFDTSQKVAGEYLRIALDGLDPGYAERRFGLFDSITRDDFARVAERLYGDGKIFVAAVGRPIGL
jgi:zinc protease